MRLGVKYTYITLQKALGKVSTMADGWTIDTTKVAFLGVTAHWIEVNNNKWEMCSEVIRFWTLSGKHSEENLGCYFVGVCDHIGIINSKWSKVRLHTV
jgi:hypothetical protein